VAATVPAGRRKWAVALQLVWLFLPTASTAELEVPLLSGRISDPAGLLSSQSQTGIEETLVSAGSRQEDVLPTPSSSTSGMGSGERLFAGGLFLFVVGMFSLMALQSPGLLAWCLYVFLIPFWALFPFALIGASIGLIPVVFWLVVFPILRVLGRRSRRVEKGGWRAVFVPMSTRGWKSTSGWGAGGGLSSAGFSGGGGRFGGGGSSSSW
jgi:uncharacterized membrane protein YgcG